MKFDEMTTEIRHEVRKIKSEAKGFDKKAIGRISNERACRFVMGELVAIENLVDEGFWTKKQGIDALGNTLTLREITLETELEAIKSIKKILLDVEEVD